MFFSVYSVTSVVTSSSLYFLDPPLRSIRMATYRPPRERIDQLAARVAEALATAPGVTVVRAPDVQAIFRAAVVENLQEEHAIEEEAEAMVRKHGQEIYEQNADFHKMIVEGKRILARKKNFTL